MDSNIKEFMIWAPQVDRATATAYLKAKKNDFQAAINAFFEGEELPRYEEKDKYDESAFTAGRDGGDVQMGETRAFEMDSSDTVNPRLLSAPTPSRSNSRMSNRGGGGDLTAEYNGDTSGEDPLEVAMRKSRQETGVTTATDPVYGPAVWIRKDDIIPDPVEPKDRKRDPGQPVFVKPLPGGFGQDHLPGIVTILSTIPLSREALLCRSILLPNYGDPHSWWSGSPVSLPRTIDTRSTAPRTDSMDVIYEAQRLMAFLQRSNRSYGSVQPLCDLPALWDAGVGDNTSDNRTVRFLRAWEKAAEHNQPESGVSKIFTSTLVSMPHDGDATEAERCWLDLSMKEGLWGSMTSLYDAMDASLWWTDQSGDSASHESIARAADIMVIHLPSNLTATGLEIPDVLYIDRYLSEHADLMRGIRRQLAQSCSAIERLEGRQDDLKNISPTRNKTFQSMDVIRTVATYFEDGARAEKDHGNAVKQSLPENMPDCSYIAQHLKMIADKVQRKLEYLEEEKERIIRQMKETASILTKSTTLPDQPQPCHKRILSGVVTNHNNTYVLYPGPAKDTEETGDDDDELQWWRLEYPLVENGPIVKTEVAEAAVLNAAKQESEAVTLIYASPEAIRSRPLDLPDPLKRFIQKDNIAFAEELGQHTQSQGPAVLATNSSVIQSAIRPEDDDILPDYEQSQQGQGWDERIPTSLQDDGDGEGDAPATIVVDSTQTEMQTQTSMMDYVQHDQEGGGRPQQEMQEKGKGGFLGPAVVRRGSGEKGRE